MAQTCAQDRISPIEVGPLRRAFNTRKRALSYGSLVVLAADMSSLCSIVQVPFINALLYVVVVFALQEINLLSNPNGLSNAQIDMIVNSLQQAGVPASANYISLKTLRGANFTIRTQLCSRSDVGLIGKGTNTGEQFQAWSSSSSPVGESIVKALAAGGLDVRLSLELPERRSFHAETTSSLNSIHRRSPQAPIRGLAALNDSSANLRTMSGELNTAHGQYYRSAETNIQRNHVDSGRSIIAAVGSKPDGLELQILANVGNQDQNGQVDHIVLVGGIYGTQYYPAYVNANVGDTISFVFGTGNHSVTRSSLSNPCSHTGQNITSGFIPSIDNLSSTNKSSAPVLRYTVQSTDPEWFYCAQENHCQSGMIFVINPTIQDTEADFSILPSQSSSALATSAQLATASTDPDGYSTSVYIYSPGIWTTSTEPYVSTTTTETVSIDRQDLSSLVNSLVTETRTYATMSWPSTYPASATATSAFWDFTSTIGIADLISSITQDSISKPTVATMSPSAVEATGLVLIDPSYTDSIPVTTAQTIVLPTYNDDGSPDQWNTEQPTVLRTINIGGEEQACYAATKAFAKDNQGGCFGFVSRMQS